MKKFICGILAGILICGILVGCAGTTPPVDKKFCFIDNPNLPLYSTKDEIIREQGLELYEEDSEMYVPKDGNFSKFLDLDWSASYFFNEDNFLRDVSYSLISGDANTDYFKDVRSHLESLYGPGEEYEEPIMGYPGFSWNISDDKGHSYQIRAYYKDIAEHQYTTIKIVATEADNSDSEKEPDSYSSSAENTWEKVGEAANEFQQGIKDSSGVTFHSIKPRNGIISQEQFDLLQKGMSYSEVMDILDSPEDVDIPSDDEYFSCLWETDTSFVMLSFNKEGLLTYNSYGLK